MTCSELSEDSIAIATKKMNERLYELGPLAQFIYAVLQRHWKKNKDAGNKNNPVIEFEQIFETLNLQRTELTRALVRESIDFLARTTIVMNDVSLTSGEKTSYGMKLLMLGGMDFIEDVPVKIEFEIPSLASAITLREIICADSDTTRHM